MVRAFSIVRKRGALLGVWVLSLLWGILLTMDFSPALAQGGPTPPQPAVAIHVSELTQALATLPAKSPTPTGEGTTGYEWWYTSWHYWVMAESLKEALKSDGTPYVSVGDAAIAGGQLLYPDGSPRYPILFSLASEAVGDDEIAPLRAYVAAGGTLFIGSSAFTRRPDGTSRGDFALASEMGLNMVNPNLQNWAQNMGFQVVADHRLVAHIPGGSLTWRMPLSSEEIPWGVSPSRALHGAHYTWRVNAAEGTTVIANGDAGPLLTIRPYGKGSFIYHGALQPLIGHGGYDSGMYAYLIYRKAIENAFEVALLPLIKLSPWRYPYDAAFVVRHDFENSASSIRAIENSAAFEKSVGAKGDYYFCTGTLREQMSDKTTTIASLRRAVSSYGATIGSHNGGLKNPVNTSLSPSDYEYWHWGPDEALDTKPTGYASGKAYAQTSLSMSFQDIEGWLAGVDNGRAGCGQTGNCPRTWVGPFFNSTREDSYRLLEELDAVSMGEQKIGLFPHWTLSTQTLGKRYGHITLPPSDWYVGGGVAQAIDQGHDPATMRAAVDFYYGLGGLINIYGHNPSEGGSLEGEYVTYSAAKPRIWAANAVGIYEWWQIRSGLVITPAFSKDGNTAIVRATIAGAVDSGTALEIVLPTEDPQVLSNLQVFINGTAANPADYRVQGSRVKVLAGTGSDVEVRYGLLGNWAQTNWSGGGGQSVWTDVARYSSANSIEDRFDGQLSLGLASNGTVLFSDNFTRPPEPLLPWGVQLGAWTVTGGVLQGSSNPSTYASIYTSATPLWTDYTVEGRVQFPAGAFGGGIGGRMNPTTGTRYGAWVYPEGSAGGSNVLKLVKFRGWTSWSGTPMQQVALADVGTSWHSLKMAFIGNRILVYYDGDLKIDVIDNNFDSRTPYLSGGISVDLWTYSNSYTMLADDISVTSQPLYISSGTLLSSAYDGGDSVQWQTISWDAAVGGGMNVCVKTRTADQSDQLVSASWSDCYPGSGSGSLSPNRRWMQYQLGLTTSDPSATPVFYEVRISYLSNASEELPVLSSLVPTSTTAGGSAFTLTVNGSGFAAGSVVRWNGSDRTTTYVSSSQLRASISASDIATAGTASVTVYNPTPGGGLSNAQTFTINGPINPVPVISSISPSSQTAGGSGFTLTVNGSNFVSGSVVRWNGSDRVTTYVSATQARAAISAADIGTVGTASVTVFNPTPGGGTSGSLSFTILAPNPAPSLTGLSPSSATAGGSAFTIAVSGSGFINGSVVRWNGSDRTTTYVSASQLTAAITAADIATTGTASVTVYNPAPGGGLSSAQSFTINSPGILFSDDFTRSPDSTNPLSPWVVNLGTWAVTGGVMQGSGNPRQYS